MSIEGEGNRSVSKNRCINVSYLVFVIELPSMAGKGHYENAHKITTCGRGVSALRVSYVYCVSTIPTVEGLLEYATKKRVGNFFFYY